MRRAEFCKKAGITEAIFKNRRASGDLPWVRIAENQASAPESHGWGGYNRNHLAAFFAATDLSGNLGVTHQLAAAILRHGRDFDGARLPGWYDYVHVSRTPFALYDGGPYFIAMGVFPDFRRVLTGSLEDIAGHCQRKDASVMIATDYFAAWKRACAAVEGSDQ